MYKLGIDVGGTNTDAVIIDETYNVIAEVKRATSLDIYEGIVGALKNVLDVSGIDRTQCDRRTKESGKDRNLENRSTGNSRRAPYGGLGRRYQGNCRWDRSDPRRL